MQDVKIRTAKELNELPPSSYDKLLDQHLNIYKSIYIIGFISAHSLVRQPLHKQEGSGDSSCVNGM